MKLRVFFVIVLAAMCLFFQSCGRPAGLGNSSAASSYPTAAATFSSINANIITPICLQCHTSQAPLLTSYATIMSGGAIAPGNASGSQMYIEVSTGAMPYQQTPLSAADVQAIYNWIQSGAPNN